MLQQIFCISPASDHPLYMSCGHSRQYILSLQWSFATQLFTHDSQTKNVLYSILSWHGQLLLTESVCCLGQLHGHCHRTCFASKISGTNMLKFTVYDYFLEITAHTFAKCIHVHSYSSKAQNQKKNTKNINKSIDTITTIILFSILHVFYTYCNEGIW